MKKLISLILAILMLCTAAAALAKTVEPEDTEYEHLAGKVIHATVGAYNENTKTFTVTLYEDDRYEAEDVAGLAAGDILLGNGTLYKVSSVEKNEFGDLQVTTDDAEFVFVQAGNDEMYAQLTDDDRRFMHAFAVLQLPAAEGIIFEDASDPDSEEPVVTSGLEAILKVKAEKEETSIGFDFYATVIELNSDLEIVRIHQDYDVAQ